MTTAASEAICRAVLDYVRDEDGGVAPEDAISSAAALVGEACLRAAGHFDVAEHGFAPGQHIFSDTVNELLSGDRLDLDELPPDSVFGHLRDLLPGLAFAVRALPPLKPMFRRFALAAGTTAPERWGWVPLSVPQRHLPKLMPLSAAFELRSRIEAIYNDHEVAEAERAGCAVGALVKVMNAVGGALPPTVALTLACETILGIAKSCPLTERHRGALRHATPAIAKLS